MPDETPRCPHGWPRSHPSACTACAADAAFDAGFDGMLKRAREVEQRKRRSEFESLDRLIGREMPWEVL